MHRRGHRGMSLSVLIVLVIPAMLIMAGLAIDGARKSEADREAQTLAAQAARAGSDAVAGLVIFGMNDTDVAVGAAQAVLDAHGMQGTVSYEEPLIVVTTETSRPTIFLSLMGVPEVRGHGQATVELIYQD